MNDEMPQVIVGTNALSYEILCADVDAMTPVTAVLALDCAPSYHTEDRIGKAVRRNMDAYGTPRSKFFLQTKLDVVDQLAGRVERAFERSLSRMQVDYLDSYLMHWPNPATFVKDWATMVSLKKSGRVRHIGVCNFRLRHWKQLLDSDPEELPEINQIEIHPLNTCDEMLDYCNSLGVKLQAYTSLCKMLPPISKNKQLEDLSVKYGCGISELVLAWHVTRGVAPITKSSKPERLKKNVLSAVTLRITDEDMDKITSLNQNYRFFLESTGCPGF